VSLKINFYFSKVLLST